MSESQGAYSQMSKSQISEFANQNAGKMSESKSKQNVTAKGQKKPRKQKKMKITVEELEKRFNEADTNGDGVLSAEQITSILHASGFEDAYQGTVKKICRSLTKLAESQMKLQRQSEKEIASDKEEQKEKKGNKEKAEPKITFEQFKEYFDVLDDPVANYLYRKELKRKISINEMQKKLNKTDIFQKDNGQQFTVNYLVGEKKSEYNNRINIEVFKNPKLESEKIKTLDPKDQASEQGEHPNKHYLDIVLRVKSEQHVEKASETLMEVFEMIKGLVASEDEEMSEVMEQFDGDVRVNGLEAILRITTEDQYVIDFLDHLSELHDELLSIEVTYLLNAVFEFDFQLESLKDQGTIIEDILTKNSHFHFGFKGSQFLTTIKEFVAAFDMLEPLRVDFMDFDSLSFLTFLYMEQFDLDLKFRNNQRKEKIAEMTHQLKEMLGSVGGMLPENVKELADSVEYPIEIRGQFNNIHLKAQIDVKNLLKLPEYGLGGEGGYNSD